MKYNEAYLVSYIQGTLSTTEMRECDTLMQSSPEFSSRVQEIEEVLYSFNNLEAQKNIETDVAWQKINRKINRKRARLYIYSFLRNTAAMLLPLFLIFQYALLPYLEQDSTQQLITLTSAPGIVTKAILPDGSEVWLNAQSELKYPLKFSSNERNVQLSGEAYFKVKGNKKNNFNVITPTDVTVSAYGTEFNVNAYKDNLSYAITLTSGNVVVTNNNNFYSEELQPGQKALVDIYNNANRIKVENTDTYVETAWRDGKLVFRRENIENIANKLSRKFGVEIKVIGNVTNDHRFTATFIDESIEDILDLLQLSGSINYTISKREKLAHNRYSQRKVILNCK